jgi:hypothetical protein
MTARYQIELFNKVHGDRVVGQKYGVVRRDDGLSIVIFIGSQSEALRVLDALAAP